jgi:hypothetical protein
MRAASRVRSRWRGARGCYCAVVVAVVEASNGRTIEGASMMTILVVVALRPVWSVGVQRRAIDVGGDAEVEVGLRAGDLCAEVGVCRPTWMVDGLSPLIWMTGGIIQRFSLSGTGRMRSLRAGFN